MLHRLVLPSRSHNKQQMAIGPLASLTAFRLLIRVCWNNPSQLGWSIHLAWDRIDLSVWYRHGWLVLSLFPLWQSFRSIQWPIPEGLQPFEYGRMRLPFPSNTIPKDFTDSWDFWRLCSIVHFIFLHPLGSPDDETYRDPWAVRH